MPAVNILAGGGYTLPAGAANPGSAQTAAAAVQTPVASGSLVVDGTPVRVAAVVIAAAAGIVALRWAGFKFNVAI